MNVMQKDEVGEGGNERERRRKEEGGRVSFWDDEMFWNYLEVMVAQHCECT